MELVFKVVFSLQHDETGQSPSCTPFTDSDSLDGNYIMYYAAIQGLRSNNYEFSPCSKASMGAILASSVNTECFTSKSSV